MTLDWFYQDWWPLVPLALLIAKDWPFLLPAAGHLLLFGKFRPALIFREVVLPLWSFIRTLISAPLALLIYLFYYVRKNSRRHQQTGIGEPLATNAEFSNKKKKKKGPAIAVVNINKSKYTETFVWQTVPRLRFRVFYLYGGELPRYDDDDRHFLSNWPSLQHWAKFVETVFHLEENYFLKNSISSYLQAKKIRLALAQFGPTAVQMMPVARDAGIPLIVYFHGYDVFHKEIVARNLAGYQILFKEAAKIIGVSELMLDRLEQLGAPREKLVHLPAYVNLELFPCADHAALPPRFLAVGRFAETKSPHLTILAFQKVLEQIPGATLTIIGKGGGGELFEACLILIRALNLEQNVVCKGVQTHEAVAEEMRNARVFVQHSLTTPENSDMEGKPVAVMEAMACGMPIVATRHSGIVELIEHEVTGLLVPEYDVEAMVAAMILLAQDDALARRLGRAAGAAIRQNPLISNNLNVLEEIIDQCIAGQVTP